MLQIESFLKSLVNHQDSTLIHFGKYMNILSLIGRDSVLF